MRNNMTASMFDLSMKDKPRSRLGKLKDKVRGKKSDGFSDSASAIVPSVSQVLTDSDGEGDAHSESPATKKKSKLKSLFAPKSNLHRNHSQSMSVLGTLPEKNSPLSGSRSSGLNVESPDVKRKIGLGKFGLGHKRTGSNDSKASQGPFSLLGRSKQSAADQNTTCINGSHVYAEEHERKTGSTLSLSSSGKGSVEDVRRQHERNFSDASTDSFKALTIPSYKPETQERKTSVPQRLTEEEEEKELDAKSQAEEKLRQAEEKRRQAEGKRIQEMLERQEDQEKKRMLERQKKVEEEEKKRKREEEERKEQQRLRQEEAKQAEEQERRRQEEARRAEEQKRHEETRVTDRLSSLFGLGRKKEEKKEEQHQENQPVAAPRRSFKELEVPASSNPFEEVSLSPDPTTTVQGPTETQRAVLNPHVPSSGFPSRTAKVSAVKPRLAEWQNPETDLSNPPSPTNTTDTQSQEQDQVSPSSLLSGSSSSSVPSDSVDMYRYYSSHSSVAPANASPGVNDEPRPDQMANEQRVGQKQAQMPALPLPDYETLFPKKRHGVMGQNRWDNIIAEVNQRRLERETDMSGPEMSVDGPSEEPPVVPETAVRQERSTASMSQSSWRQVEMHREIPEARTVSGTRQALQPPKPTAAATPRPQAERETVVAKPRHSQGNERIRIEHELPKEPPVPASRASQIQNHSDRSSTDVSQADRQIPSVKPRQKTPMKEPTEPLQPEATQDKNMDPFPNSSVQLRDPWNTPQPNKDQDDLFSGGTKKEVKPEERGLTADDLDQIFESARPSDPFSNLSQNGSARSTEQNKPTKAIPKEVRASPESSQKKRQAPKPPTSLSDTRNMFMDRVGRHSGRRQYDTRKSKPDVKTQDAVLSEKPISTGPEEEPVSTSSGPPESSIPGAGDFATHPVGLKTPARAWVSPSDVQPVATQSSGGGPSATLRRPHPVKPLSAQESQHPGSSSVAVSKDLKSISITDMPEKLKRTGSGPYTQLTQEELITLVVKQQTELTKRDEKIVELEEYIDNLLVRVIEEQPSILMSLAAAKGSH
ncbi:rab11 family-interacting protein 1 isoform X3 [Sardina pilchardus]